MVSHLREQTRRLVKTRANISSWCDDMLVLFIQINQEDRLTKLSETWDTTEPVGSQALCACSSKHAKNVNSAAVWLNVWDI